MAPLNSSLQKVHESDRFAFAPVHGASGGEQANAFVERHGERIRAKQRRGRGASLNPGGRFEPVSRHVFEDGWQSFDDLTPFKTEVQTEKARKIITRNESPDVPFDRSINPYRGCEHGCVYCFARPSHAFMGLSAGVDFESKLFAKPNAAMLLRKELAALDYEPRCIALGTNTDPYQPIEKDWRVTREILEVLEDCNHPVGIVTKGGLVARDIDILGRMARKGLARVAVSVTTLDRKLSRSLEPRAATPTLRLETIRKLTDAGIPTSVMVAPMIPALNDHEMERILDAAKANGAQDAGFVLLRLPHEVAGLFKDWVLRNYPEKYTHVMSLIRSMRDGKDYDAEWGTRMRGSAPYAWQLGRRFEIATKRLKLNAVHQPLRTDLFKPPVLAGTQLSLF